jgi:phage terminase large subunit-like protein
MPTATRPKRTSAKAPRAPRIDPVTAYAKDVTEGRIVTGKWVRLACERHLCDLERDDLIWDVEAVKKVVGFFRDVLRLNGGDFEGKPFILQPWQAFIVGSLFGWKTPDGYRRFRTGYIEIGKGNGKSPLAAGIGMYMLTADGEARAEVYSGATKKDQAMVLFRDAVAMKDQSPALASRITPSGSGQNVWNLAYSETGSWFRPISSDDAQSGPRPHCGLLDEIHEHKTSIVIDMMRAGTKGRRQALIFEITNSGYDRQSICWQHHDYSTRILDRAETYDPWFAYVCTLDEGDDWTDPSVWVKANPNIGISVTEKYLREQVREAQGMPGKQNVVKRLNFCIWTEQDTRWLDMDTWRASAGTVDEAALRGRQCFAGLDLASTSDIAALDLLFPPIPEDPNWYLLPYFWVPEESARTRTQKDRVLYEQWAADGVLQTTPGNITDYEFIREKIKELAESFLITELVYDRWNATQLITQLGNDGLTVVPFGQGFASMAAPTKEFDKLLREGVLRHGNHPVLTWMAGNVAVIQDPAGNLKPDKNKSSEKIDGIVAGIMALGRAMVAPAAIVPAVFVLPDHNAIEADPFDDEDLP